MSAPPPYDAAYPPAQDALPQQTKTTATVVVQQPATTVQQVTWRELPMSYNCHICHTQQVTRVSYNSGTLTFLICVILCLVGLWPCSLIPFCIDDTKDVYHTCPNCNNQVGVYKRM